MARTVVLLEIVTQDRNEASDRAPFGARSQMKSGIVPGARVLCEASRNMFAELAVVLDLTRLKVKRTFFCSCAQEALPGD